MIKDLSNNNFIDLSENNINVKKNIKSIKKNIENHLHDSKI